MNKIYFLLLILLGGFDFVNAQVQLGPSIGIGEIPDDNTPICDIPLYLGGFDLSGYFIEDLIPDFNLFNLEGEELIMSELLDQGKPVLLVSGSYTCPVFRGKTDEINDIIQNFGAELEVIIIYGVEAHPIIDISPYFGYVNPGNANISSNILYQQPTTYGERKSIVEDMLNEMDIQAPVYIDGPCNDWWAHFGPAPNNAYLIGTDGIVLSKHSWFDKYPSDIYCDLENYLDLNTDCEPAGSTGDFLFEMTSSQFGTGPAGSTVYVTGLISNQSDNGVEIQITRMTENLPSGWSTSICTDVCYPTTQTEAIIWLDAGDTLDYTNYFYTDAVPASGNVKIGFRNTNNFQNQYIIGMAASTYATTSDNDLSRLDNSISIFPNPAKAGDPIHVEFSESTSVLNGKIDLFNARGVLLKSDVLSGTKSTIIEYSLSPGIYWYRCHLSNGSTQSGSFLVH